MGGTTKRYDTTPAATAKLRGPLGDWLMGGSGGGGGPSAQFPNKATPQQQAYIDAQNARNGTKPGTGGPGSQTGFDRINARGVQDTQSIDQLGGADSPFFKNMMAQYQPAFDQKRKLALAQAKESSGTLTGSGYANTMGTAVNRSLADENLAVSGIAQYGISQEMGRQQNRYNQQSDTARSDARNFMELLMSQAGLGVGPDTIKTSGGIGALLDPLMKLYALYKGQQTPGTGTTDGGGGGSGTPQVQGTPPPGWGPGGTDPTQNDY